MIVFFLKFVEKRIYAENFLSGNLYLNPLKYFIGIEEGADGRADRFELTRGWHQPRDLGEITVGSITISPSHLAGPLIMQSCAQENSNILCLYAGVFPKIDKASGIEIEELRRSFHLPEQCLSMGREAALVHNPRAFLRRVEDAVNASGFGLDAGMVDYFDPSNYSGTITRPGFSKRNDFSWQREYRLILDRRALSPEPFVLEVGDLHDICSIVDVTGFNDQIQVNPRAKDGA